MHDVEQPEAASDEATAGRTDAGTESAELTIAETACTAAGGMAIAVAGLYFLAPICFSC